MKPLTKDDLLDLTGYEKVRKEKQAEAIQTRKLRRVHLGEMITLAFENSFTIWYQIMEMIRAERLVEDDAIEFELDTYNPLIPGESELSATLFIEIPDNENLREWLPKLPGIEQAISLEIEGAGAAGGEGEEGRSKEEITSTVHYVRFALDPAQRDAVIAGADCRLVAAHPNYAAEATLPPELVGALGKDLS